MNRFKKHRPIQTTSKSIVEILRNDNKHICGFIVKNHTDSFVCAAISVLTLNTINSIENFTDEQFTCDADEQSAIINFLLTDIKQNSFNKDVDLLLNSFLLGIKGIESEYNKYLNVIDGGAINA